MSSSSWRGEQSATFKVELYLVFVGCLTWGADASGQCMEDFWLYFATFRFKIKVPPYKLYALRSTAFDYILSSAIILYSGRLPFISDVLQSRQTVDNVGSECSVERA